MNRWVQAVDRMLERTLVLLFSAMVLNVLWQVSSRYLLQRPSPYSEELARFLLIWLGLIGSCYAFRRRMHLAVEVAVDRLGGAARRIASVLSLALVATFSLGVMVVGGLHLVTLTLDLEQSSAALGLPLGLVYLALPLSGTLMLFYVALAVVEALRAAAAE